jgi:hypothetical protein
MSDLTSENAGANPPEGPPHGEAEEAQTQAAQPQVAAAAAEQPTAVMPAAAAAAPSPAGPQAPWYRRTWALVVGVAVAAAILFLGGMAAGGALADHGHGDFRDFRDFRGPFPGAPGSGQRCWGDGGGIMPPMMGQGHGWDQGGGWRQGNSQSRGWPPAPNVTPSATPSASTQSYDFQ